MKKAVSSLIIALTLVAMSTLSCLSAEDLVERGDALFESGKYDEALREYTNAIRIALKFADAYYKIGDTNIRMGKLSLAESNYKKAIELNPALPSPYPSLAIAYYNRANLSFEVGQPEWAEGNFKNALRLDPTLPDPYPALAAAHYNRGTAFLEKGNIDRARSDFDSALRLNPDLPDPYHALSIAYYNRGQVLLNISDLDRARSDFDNALRLNPDLPGTYHALADAYYDRADASLEVELPESAEADYKIALRLNPDLPDPYPALADTYYNLGIAYLERGGLRLGKSYYEKAVRMNPEYGNPSYRSRFNSAVRVAEELIAEVAIVMERQRAQAAARDKETLARARMVGQIIEEWRADADTFEDKFFGKKMAVRGVVKSVRERIFGTGYTVTLKHDHYRIDCNAEEAGESILESIKPGQTVEVSGSVGSGIFGPDLYNCEIIHVVQN